MTLQKSRTLPHLLVIGGGTAGIGVIASLKSASGICRLPSLILQKITTISQAGPWWVADFMII